MAGNVFVKILDANAKKEAILDYDYIEYTSALNRIGSFEITIKGGATYNFTKYVPWEASNANTNEQGIVYFYKGSNLEFKGFITRITYDTKGRIVLRGPGTLGFARRNNITDANRSVETADTRATAFIGDCSKLDEGTTTFTAGNVEVKTYNKMNVYEGLYDLVVRRKNNEFYMTYDGTIGNEDNFEVRVRAGSSTSIGKFVVGKDIGNITREYNSEHIINSVEVLGKFDGDNDVYFKGDYTDGDDGDSDGSSVTKYGTLKPREPIIDRGCKTNAECTAKAKNIVLNWKDAREHIILNDWINVDYTTENPDSSRAAGRFALGDRITVTDVRSNLDEADLRIVGFTRSIDKMGKERLNIKTIVEGLKYITGKTVRLNVGMANRDGGVLSKTSEPNEDHPHGSDDELSVDNHTHAISATTSDVTLVTQSAGTGVYGYSNGVASSNSWNALATAISNASIAGKESFEISMNILNNDGTDYVFFLRFCKDEVTPTRFYPNSTGMALKVRAGASATFFLRVPVQWFSESTNFQIQVDNDAGSAISYDWSYYYVWVESHKHTISSDTAEDNVADVINDTDSVQPTFTEANVFVKGDNPL